MRKILLGIDLAICSLWTIAALGSRIAWVDTPVTWIVMLLTKVSQVKIHKRDLT